MDSNSFYRLRPCLLFFAVAASVGCSVGVGGFSWSFRQTAIARVKQGDTARQVERKIGSPHEILADEKTPDGRRKVIWGYQAVSESAHSVSGFLQAPARYPVSLRENSEINFGTSDYLVVFIDGKVDSVIYR